MNKEICDYLDNNSVNISEIINYEINDKFLIYKDKLYIITTQRDFVANYTNDYYLAVKLKKFDTSQKYDSILKDTAFPDPYDTNFAYYKLINTTETQSLSQLELIHIIKNNNDNQNEKLSSINNKLTFFTIITIINLIGSIILIYKLLF